MEDVINGVLLLDKLTIFVVIGLSVLWSYLLYEALGQWSVSVFGLPVFIVFSLVAVHYLRMNSTNSSHEIELIFGWGIGSIVGLLATLLAVRLVQSLAEPRLPAKR